MPLFRADISIFSERYLDLKIFGQKHHYPDRQTLYATHPIRI
ncbi:unnamed protein product [Acidithrix sp. C25]|nr:unnamed protein product [Acidithrix sp. C25]